jgi:hypothetical protein
LDEVTTLENASAEGRILTYHYRLSRKEISDKQLVALVRKTMLPKLCGNSEMREAFNQYGITYRFSYSPPSGSPVTVDIDAKACAGS